MPQTARMQATMSAIKTATPDGGQARVEQVLSFLAELANGTGNGQADAAFVDKDRAIASGATEDIDVAGSLTDALGQTLAAAEIVGIAMRAPTTNTANLTIGGATAELQAFFAAAGDKAILKPGDWFIWYSHTGFAVSAGSTDDWRVVCGAGDGNTFDIGFLGRSA